MMDVINNNIIKDTGFSLLSEGMNIRVRARGYSMYPTIKPGNAILIEPINLKGIPKPGEIIAIKRDKGFVVHRLVRITIKDGIRLYIARGDSNAYADNPVTIDKIAGRISGPVNKKPVWFINRIRVIFLLLWRRR